MKKLINAADQVVKESLAGFAAAHSDLVNVRFDPDFIVRADAPVKGKVGEWFYLFLMDQDTLEEIIEPTGWKLDRIYHSTHGMYIAILVK